MTGLLTTTRRRVLKDDIFDKEVANYVFARKPPRSVAPGVVFVSEL
jgi:hypothetical protein